MSDFPNSLDALDDKEDAVDYPQAAHINDLNDAVEKTQTKVGIDNSAVASSLDYIIKNTTSGHDHDGSDSKKVIATNLNPTGLTASQLLRVNSGATAIESSGKTVPTGDIVGTSDTQTLTAKTLTSPILNTGLSGTAFLDEDDMASDSATKAASQQSIKAYVDTHTADTTTHGAAGAVVGTTNSQTLTNKTLTSPVLSTGVSGTAVLDEDNMASDSADAGFGASLFHATLVEALPAWVAAAAASSGVASVACARGCFLNTILARGLRAALAARGIAMLEANAVPPNDGGLSLGQAAVAQRLLTGG